jgi:DNA-binding CsgD family transcriptional regulator
VEPTLERETELARIRAALEAAAGGEGHLVVVEGPAGIGKTRLLEEAQALAKAQGFGRLRAVGDEPERSLPWGVVRQMAERSMLRYSGDVRKRILAGPTGAALRALDEVPEPGSDEVALARTLHKLWWVAADLSADRPLLITVDDAQWADVASLRFLAYLSRRLSDLSVALVIGTRPVESPDGPLAELATARTGDHLVPAPLSVDGVRALAGGGMAEAVAAALHAASGGNPFFAEQLATELVRGGHDPIDPRSADAVGTLAPQTVARVMLARQGPDEAALAAAAAVLGARSDPVVAARLADLDAERALAAADALRREHVFSAEPTVFEFAHPVVREAVLAGVAPGARASLHVRAAEALLQRGDSAERVSAHVLEAPVGSVPGAGPLLRAAARRILGTGDPAAAARLLRRAREEGWTELEAELGRALLAAGEAQEARELLLVAARDAKRDRERAERLALAAVATERLKGVPAASAELMAAIEKWPGRPQDRLPLDARLALINSYVLGGAKGSFEHLMTFADLPGETAEERVLLAMLTQRMLNVPRPGAEVREVGLRALSNGAMARQGSELLAWGICLHALTSVEAIDECEAELDAARNSLAGGGAPADFACIGMSSAYVAWVTGDLRRAEADAMAAMEALTLVDPGPMREALRAVATRHAVLSQIEQGKLDSARESLALHDAEAVPSEPISVPVSRLRLARATYALAAGDPGTALAQARRLDAEESVASAYSVAVGWRMVASRALARLGREDEARTLAEEHLAAARACEVAGETGMALRLVARMDPDGRLERLEEAVALLEASPDRLQLAGALADLGEALGVAGRRKDAKEPLTRAFELAEACAARPLAQRAADGLAALGDRPRRIAEAGFDELTASERRVAQLAAGGQTNREIAQELFVTPKTVENHLRHAYAKLGVGGRRELAGVLG